MVSPSNEPSADGTAHERLLIQSFVRPQKRARLISFLRNSKLRRKLLNSLYHFNDLDERFAYRVPTAEDSAEGINRLLKCEGAPDACWVMSTDESLDGRNLPLDEAISAIVGCGQGSFVSCIPGELAYHEGETPHERYVLKRTSRK